MIDIEKVAVIGCGPAGIATIYELLHTTKDGESTVGKAAAENCKFKVTGFEQKDKAGGIWSPNFDEADLPVPPQELLDTEKYNDPRVISPKVEIPSGVSNGVRKPTNKVLDELEWKKSGIFRNLYTNIAARFTRFSYMENDDKYYNKSRRIYPFMTHIELCDRIDNFIETEKLNDHIRFNSSVKSVTKVGDKWRLVVKKSLESDEDEWYEEDFDAVVMSNGQFTVPNFPYSPGMAEFNKNFPNSLMHSNSYRSPDEFKGKRVLVVGGSISTINVLQYIVPVAETVVVSSRGDHPLYPWITKAIRSDGIDHKTIIKEYKPNGDVVFTDGSIEPRFDKIVFTTGYHRHFPFLNDDNVEVTNISRSERIRGLYYNTFSIEDPTLAVAGATTSPLAFHSMEGSAAAIAGVWSGAGKLPSKEDQKKWEQERIKEVGDNASFHFFAHTRIKKEYFDVLEKFMAKGRMNPLHVDGDHVDDIDKGVESIEKLFYKVKTGEFSIADTMNP